MPIFHYTGRYKDSRFVEDKCESPSLGEAIDQLSQQGIFIIDISAESGGISLKELMKLRIGPSSVRVEELIMLSRQLYTLTKAGISIAVSIQRLAQTVQNPKLSGALSGMEKKLLSGQSLGNTLRQYPDIFPPIFVELVQVGEESGYLEESFLQINNYLLLEYTTNKQFKSAMRYPIMVMVAIIGAILVMNVFVVPRFAALYSGFNTKLPLPTELMISFSNMLQQYWVYTLLFIILLIISARYYLHTPNGKLKWHRYQLRMPIIGSILERIVISRFARTLAIIFRAGIPLGKGMPLLGSAVGNEYIRQHITDMQRRIENGESLSQAATATHLFTPLVLQMISVGEETGMIDNMLQEVAEFYDREINYDLEMLAERIEPVLLLLVGGMVLFLAIAVFLPMWDIYQFARAGH